MNLNDKQNRTESPDVPAEMAEVTAVDVVSPVRADAAEESVEEIGARTLSPGRLVMKRFFRSRLSMTGLIVLLVLFVFSFAGPLMKFLPFVWGEKQADESQQIEQAYYTEVESPAGDGSKVWIVHYSHPTNYLSERLYQSALVHSRPTICPPPAPTCWVPMTRALTFSPA